jgi:hypothetical protein
LLWSLCYVALRRVLQLTRLRFRSDEFKELEIVVLRVGFANSGGLVFVDESAEEIATL